MPNLFDPAFNALFALQDPEAMAEILAAKGITPPASPAGLAGGGVEPSLGALLEPSPAGATTGTFSPPGNPLAALMGGGMTPQQQGPFAGVKAPPTPQMPNVSTPAAPRPSQAIDPGNLIQLLLSSNQQPQMPTLASLLGR